MGIRQVTAGRHACVFHPWHVQTLCTSVAAKLVASLLIVLLHVPVKQHGKTMHHVMCNAHDLQRSQCAEAAKRKIICDNGVYARYQISSGRCSLMKLQIMLSYTKQRRRRSSYSASFNISVLVVLSTSLKYDRQQCSKCDEHGICTCMLQIVCV